MILCVKPGGNMEEAQKLADKIKAKILIEQEADGDKEQELILQFASDGLTLRSGNLSMQGDFTHMLSRIKQGSLQREFLYKASKLKNLGPNPIAIDATAGMGEDSLILAAAGYEVYLYELNPIIAALLKDTVRRSATIPELAPIVSRMHVMEGNSIEAMTGLHVPEEIENVRKPEDDRVESENPFLPGIDLILLDPMFPARKKSGLIKKKFQLLQRLEQPCSDEVELMEAAFRAKPRRILVKRPQKGPYLAEKKPDYSIPGKAIRYDIYTVRVTKG